MYGNIDITKARVQLKLAERTLEFIKNADYVMYRRLKDDNLEYECMIKNPETLLIEPAAPIFIPKQLTHYILIEFANDVMLPPEGELEGYTLMPVDIVVFSLKDDNYRGIDTFSECKVKYALYGPKDEGIIARYYKSRFFTNSKEPEAYKEALVPLEIVNTHNDWVKLKRILMDAVMLRLYYKQSGSFASTQKIKISITSETTALIDYGKQVHGGLKEAKRPLRLSILMHVPRKTEMMWGI